MTPINNSVLADIIKLAKGGTLFAEAKVLYPFLLEGFYKKHGGKIKEPAFHSSIVGTQSERKETELSIKEEVSLEDRLFLEARSFKDHGFNYAKVVYDSTFGDGHITKPPSPLYMEGHAFAQSPYLWSKACLLGPTLSSVRIYLRANKSIEEDAMMSIKSTSFGECADLRALFYSEEDGSKNILRREVYDNFDMQTLAWWIMDDGTRANPSGGLSVTIGKQPHYSLDQVKLAVSYIAERTGMVGHAAETQLAYEITYTKDLEKLIPYFHPAMAYKVTKKLWSSEIGSYWPKGVINKSNELFTTIEHPYFESACTLEEKRVYLTSRTRARGFPFPHLDLDNTKELFAECLKAKISVEHETGSTSILASAHYNSLPSRFFPNRYLVSSAGRKSPIDIFCHKHDLMDSMNKQLLSGGHLKTSNIRNALSFYSGAKGAAQFNPVWVKWLVEKFKPEGTDTVSLLDSCGGWGGRMVGSALAGASLYSYIEPEPDTYKGLDDLSLFLKSCGVTTSFKGYNLQAESPEVLKAITDKHDMLLTCPPYYDHEIYSRHSKQSTTNFKTYHTWKKGFLLPMVQNAVQLLKERATAIIVMGDVGKYHLVTDTINIAISCGLQLVTVVDICGSGRRDTEYKEKALIFKR